jgi:hypothetical protein
MLNLPPQGPPVAVLVMVAERTAENSMIKIKNKAISFPCKCILFINF